MKTKCFAIGLLAVALIGCSVFKQAYTPNVVLIPESFITNAAGSVIYYPAHLETNYTPNQGVITSIKSVGQTAELAGIPWATLGTGLALLLYGAGATLVNANNNRKSKAIQQELVNNVESARDIIRDIPVNGPKLDKEFKADIINTQTTAGIRSDIKKLL